ncbi:hypothetical protein [Legionella maioricensis]|uniref:Uncharacterized protein n=1 Tax=Legionella maioricensis TaxID=2896528 RepID=A0A9X2ICC7_9GAMM|nr:hypothetical protein [Legionella maioricensis]MCL9685789.1 hypothetical protein [Legionella maioricensis]MCL9689206.1 hypothetical protein [Legionella maioricensis]
MLVLDVLIFINDLKDANNLISCDVVFCNASIKRFAYRDPVEPLNTDDIQFLIDTFKHRRKEIKAGFENDYTLNMGEANQKWIQFAKDLASSAQKNYVQILFPDISNNVDFNNLSLLTETERPENFYLGQDNRTLYRKRGLCEHLIKQNFILSTRRVLNSNKLSAMSVEELTRLQSCRQVNGDFSIGEESFTNFWDFLQKKVFTRLQSAKDEKKNERKVQVDLLPHFLALIEEYYALKTTRADFKLFRQSAQLFFAELYKYPLKDINFFYGIEIPFKDKKYYLLDFLIVINKAESYVLDEHLRALAEWLFNLHPALKVSHKELKPLYRRVRNAHFNSARQEDEYLFNECLKMLLSLFTLEFDCFPLTSNTINFWDRTNSVFSEGKRIFSLFEPLLAANRTDALVPLYCIVREDYIIPGMTDRSCFTWLTRSNSIHDWYRRADRNTLDKLGVHWVQPELLMHVLLRVRTHEPRIASQINKFLDELIHTYTQNNYDLLKQLRVNILFSNFINELPSREGKYLVTLMQLYDKCDAKPVFLNNCIWYIVNRLSNISTVTAGGAIQFFSGIRKIPSSKLIISNIKSDNLNEVIDAIKNQLYSPDLNLDGELLEKMTIYLRSLTRSILTVEQLQEASNSARTVDYLGAPT